jgi:hypothetical protein
VRRIRIARANPILPEVPGKSGAAVKVQLRRNIICALPAIAGCGMGAVSLAGVVERATATHHALVDRVEDSAVNLIGGFEIGVAKLIGLL